jgi:hypothetical protein
MDYVLLPSTWPAARYAQDPGLDIDATANNASLVGCRKEDGLV